MYDPEAGQTAAPDGRNKRDKENTQWRTKMKSMKVMASAVPTQRLHFNAYSRHFGACPEMQQMCRVYFFLFPGCPQWAALRIEMQTLRRGSQYPQCNNAFRIVLPAHFFICRVYFFRRGPRFGRKKHLSKT